MRKDALDISNDVVSENEIRVSCYVCYMLHFLIELSSCVASASSDNLTSDEDTQRANVRVDQRQVERSKVKIRVSDSDEYSLVDCWIALIHLVRRLPAPTLVRSSNLKRRVRSVDLADPGQELRLTSSSGGDVAVVGANDLAGIFPLEEDLAAGEGQGLGLVARDGRRTVVARGGVVDAGLGVG